MPGSWVCLDASFVVGLTTHPRRRAFEDLIDEWLTHGTRLAAPQLFPFEITNAAHQFRRNSELSEEAVSSILETALALPIELQGDDDLHREALLLAEKFDLPAAYDAHYLALAGRLGCTLWTTDQRLIRAVTGHVPKLRSPLTA